jgi:hypothetical protein
LRRREEVVVMVGAGEEEEEEEEDILWRRGRPVGVGFCPGTLPLPPHFKVFLARPVRSEHLPDGGGLEVHHVNYLFR